MSDTEKLNTLARAVVTVMMGGWHGHAPYTDVEQALLDGDNAENILAVLLDERLRRYSDGPLKKPFLLILNNKYYPREGTGDWIGCFATREQALAHVDTFEHHGETTERGELPDGTSQINPFAIIDLRRWMGMEPKTVDSFGYGPWEENK